MGRIKTVADDDLLLAARQVFQAKGHAATTRDVARAAGISQAVLYQRFSSRDDLFLRAMAPPPIDLDDILGSLPETPEAAHDDLRRIGRRLVAHLCLVAPAMLQVAVDPVLRAEIVRRGHAHLGAPALITRLIDRVADFSHRGLIRAGQPPTTIVETLTTLAHGVVLQRVLHGGLVDADDAVRQFDGAFNLLWRGLGPHP